MTVNSFEGKELPSKFTELPHEYVDRMAISLQEKNGVGISRLGAYAVHSLTYDALSNPLNERLHTGDGLIKRDKLIAGCIKSGLNELPAHKGPVVFHQERHSFHVGDTTVLTKFHNAVPEKGDPTTNHSSNHKVEVRVQSKTGRDISSLVESNGGESRIVLSPGTQLRTLSIESLTETNEYGIPLEREIIHAQEILPGDPDYLDQKSVHQNVLEQRANARSQESNNLDSSSQETRDVLNKDTASALDPNQSIPTAHARKKPDWSVLNKPTAHIQAAAIHSATSQSSIQELRFLRQEVHPEITTVNPNVYDFSQKEFRFNCTESVIAYEKQRRGVAAETLVKGVNITDKHDVVTKTAQSVISDQLNQTGSPKLECFPDIKWMDTVDLAGEISDSSSYDTKSFTHFIEGFQLEPLGTRAIVNYSYEGMVAGSEKISVGHTISAEKTKHGVVFFDPQMNRLALLPTESLSRLQYTIVYRPAKS